MKAFITAVCGIAVASGVLLGADIHDVVGNWEVTAIGWNGQDVQNGHANIGEER